MPTKKSLAKIAVKLLVPGTAVWAAAGPSAASAAGQSSAQAADVLLAAGSIAGGSWLDNAVLAVLLLIAGFVGISLAMLLRGFGWAGIAGIAAFGVYFAGHYAAGDAALQDVGLFVLGLLLLALELFVPSFGLLGLLGTAGLIGAVVFASPDPGSAFFELVIALAAAFVIVLLTARKFKDRGIWNRFILRESLSMDKGTVPAASKEKLLGAAGTALTPLRPAGIVEIGGERIDVVTEGEFIAASKAVKVIKVEGTRIIVKELDES
ncbi:NfeD family protein [Paenibacillus beijingensis]|uniref:NfeD family protein n=1 Tax=Paenibacillus beijingensis TaxID=1126833 RepID=UPI000698F788|nr:NfeD family protein [Paenibacillus beijingensis]